MKIVSTNIGQKQTIRYKGKSYHTGIVKKPVAEGIVLGKEDVVGDKVIDRKHHGGIQQAAYAFGLNHYTYFEAKYPNLEWHNGMFGENITVDEMDEREIHQGDQFSVGSAIVEVTIPRYPCATLGARFQDMSVVKAFWATDHPGVYFKIVKTGRVQSGDTFTRIKHCPENPTISEQFDLRK